MGKLGNYSTSHNLYESSRANNPLRDGGPFGVFLLLLNSPWKRVAPWVLPCRVTTSLLLVSSTQYKYINTDMSQKSSKDRLRDPAFYVTARDHATYPSTFLTYLFVDLWFCMGFCIESILFERPMQCGNSLLPKHFLACIVVGVGEHGSRYIFTFWQTFSSN